MESGLVKGHIPGGTGSRARAVLTNLYYEVVRTAIGGRYPCLVHDGVGVADHGQDER